MTQLAIITSSVVAEDDKKRFEQLEKWDLALIENFRLCGVEAVLTHTTQPHPMGFAFGMNSSLHGHIEQYGNTYDYLLCLNDDLHPNDKCIEELWRHKQENLVVCPTVDFTSCPEQAATGPKHESPRRAAFVPAICWLMPHEFVQVATHRLGRYGGRRQLFDESLGRAWFEDDLTAAVWRRYFDPRPFLIAPTAWAHHEGSRTSNAIPAEERHAARAKFEARVKELEL